MAGRQPPDDADPEDHEEGRDQQDHGDRRRAGTVPALDPREDVDGGDLGLVRKAPRDDHERADLADRARRRARLRRGSRGGCSAARCAGRSSARRRRASVRPAPCPGRARGARAAPFGRRAGASRTGESHTIAVREKATSTPIGDDGPYSARGSTRPATMVGRAKGRSMIAFTVRLPRKSSTDQDPRDQRPGDAVDRGDRERGAELSFSAATDCGLVTTSQKLAEPSFVAP